jgi:polysaccharide biosynthesis/export protein
MRPINTRRRTRTARRHMLSGALAIALLAPAANAQFQGNPPTQLSPQPHPGLIERPGAAAATLLLQTGDLFQVQVFNVPKFDYRGRLDDKGMVNLPLIGDVHLGGLSVSDAEHELQRVLREREMIKDPQVVITVLESPNNLATITGEVKTPGPVPVYGDKHLLDVISAAGGFTPVASPFLNIYRRGRAEPIQVHLSADASALAPANILIQPGDSIVVARLGVVYVVGATHTQGAIPLKNTSPLTLIEALSLAGGVNFEAAHDKAYILRVQGEERAEIRFDVKRVLQHRDPDTVLQNDDIVLIPSSAMRAALKNGAAGVAATLVAGVGYIAVR